MAIIDVIIPAFNEEKAIGRVIAEIPRTSVRHIVVCDNGSSDATAEVALAAGAVVVSAPMKGYGTACLAGMAYIAKQPQPDIVVFLDGDYSDYPEEMLDILAPILANEADMVIGSRVLGDLQPGSMTPQQMFGNWLATLLLRWFYGYRFTDLGPFRAIRYESLLRLGMCDPNFGWTVEMQIKAAKMRLRCTEIPVRYRPRIGTSKVSGTIKGTVLAGHKILWWLFKSLAN